MNRRGQGLSTNAIILIILGVVVLVVLIIGFTMGWSRIAPWMSSNNVDTIVKSCATACVANNKYDFCSVQRELNDGTTKVTTDCATFSVISSYSKYGVGKCPSISCDFECESIKIGDKTASEKPSCGASEDNITSIAKISGEGMKYCCIAK